MKKTVLISIMICSIAFYMSSCINVNIGNGGKNLVGNGILKEKERGQMDFNALETRGSIDVYISESSDIPITVSGDENLIDSIETYVKDDVLHVHFKKGYNYNSRKGLKVTIPNNGKINRINSSGSSDIYIEGCLTADNISITTRGSSDIKGNIKAGNVDMDCSGSSDFKGNVEAVKCTIKCTGSSDCTISGSADECTIAMTGSSDFKGYDFTVKKSDCSASGSSDIRITCTDELSVRASGSSDVYYRGNAKVANKHLSGASDLYNK
ncbi:MAG TPA: hypothetical protein DEQ30_10785 [Porphyromonadaceae bacterium]|nr:hypothetical protein [Porphyromonadaceae bacterium]